MDQLLMLNNEKIASLLSEARADRLAQAAQHDHSRPRPLRRTLQLLSARLSNGRAGPLEQAPPAPRPAA